MEKLTNCLKCVDYTKCLMLVDPTCFGLPCHNGTYCDEIKVGCSDCKYHKKVVAFIKMTMEE